MRGYAVTATWRGRKVRTFKDIVKPHLTLLFVGLNPSPVSVAKGHYHQGRLGQRFWKLLTDHRLLPIPAPGEFHDDLLLAHGFGITDLVKVPSARADALDPIDVEHGRRMLRLKIMTLKPSIVCSVYKSGLQKLTGLDLRNQWGLLEEGIGESRLFVLPFPYQSSVLIRKHMKHLRRLLGVAHDAR